MAYMVSEGLQFSGVVAILFAGISMAHYTVRNLSAGTRRFSMQLFRVLAMVCESLVFVYIGMHRLVNCNRVFPSRVKIVCVFLRRCCDTEAVQFGVCSALVLHVLDDCGVSSWKMGQRVRVHVDIEQVRECCACCDSTVTASHHHHCRFELSVV